MNARSRAVGLLAGLAILISWTLSAQEVGLGLLGETIPSNGFVSLDGISIDLSALPQESLGHAPTGDDVVYGALQLGNGSDRTFSLAFRLGEVPLLWIDANNNEDLLDDETAVADIVLSTREYAWYREVTVSYEASGGESAVPYILRFSAQWFNDAWHVSYSSFCARAGLVLIGETLHRIFLVDLDSDALFDDIRGLFVGIDTDGDGKLSWDTASPEWFAKGWPIDFSGFVQIDNRYYQVVEVSADGRRIELAEFASTLEPLPVLLPGYPAPPFTALTIEGDVFSYGDSSGSPVLLLFAPVSQVFPDTFNPCTNDTLLPSTVCGNRYPVGSSRTLLRTREILDNTEDLRHAYDVNIILIATDLAWYDWVAPEEAAALELPVPLLWDEAPMNRYRTTYYGAFLIDGQGVIVARDRVSPCYDEQGYLLEIEPDPLSYVEILERLETMNAAPL